MPSLSLPSAKTTSKLPNTNPTPLYIISESLMSENIDNAKSLITKWDPKTTNFTSLFLTNRKEAKDFIMCVQNLRKAMHFYVSQNSSSHNLVLAQTLMQTAMHRLEKEFYHVLSTNRHRLDPDSLSGGSSSNSEDYDVAEDDVDNVATSDLKTIADCMTMCGYGKECVKIYKIIRKSIVDEGLYKLGIEQLTSSQVHRMDKVVMEQRIKNWLTSVRVAVKTLFSGERILCDHVFAASDNIKQSCFAEITRDGAINTFRFAELVAKSTRSTDKIFRLLDIYETMTKLSPEIESIFSFDSTSAVRSQALSSLLKLGDSVRSLLSDFESSIQKHSSKSPIAGGGIHPLTRSAMEFIALLADYGLVLSGIVADWPLQTKSQLPESYFDSPTDGESPTSAVSVRIAWLILVLLCKLDRKAEIYKDVALSYLFLANNLQFVVRRVLGVGSLRYLLGEDWILKQQKKVKQYAANYETVAWSKVKSSLPESLCGVKNDWVTKKEMSKEEVKECFRRFNSAFEEAYRKQGAWIVVDGKLREEVKVSVAKKVVNVYREFYEANVGRLSGESGVEKLVRFGPDDLGNYLSDLLHGSGVSEGLSTMSSSSSSLGSS